MGTRGGDVAGSVHEVVAAFDKAVNLVRRIEDRKDGKNDPEALRDLFRSLSLGPVIVQGYFDADSKRFGPSYLYGDYQAQVELRDVLLGLKNLVGDLQDVLLDDSQIDFRQLQETSDACRSNAGVCLGQLSQRLAQARSDPMAMQFQNPPPQYMSGVPSMGSPGLHYSSSRSTHSSGGGGMPNTPDPFSQQHNLSPQWQPKGPDLNEQYVPHHRRRSTDASLQESYENWSQTSQLVTERDADELSIRRPSSHTLAPEDGALLSPGVSPGVSPDGAYRRPMLPGQQDRTRDSYTSLNLPSGTQSPARQSDGSSGGGRQRYGPGDFSPVHPEQHGPFLIDRSSTQSVTSYASRASHTNHSTLEHIAPDYRRSAEPPPLRLPSRPSQQPIRQTSGGPSSPPRKPIPAVPYESFTGHAPINKHTDIPVRVPTHIQGQKVPIPPRSQSRPVPDAGIPQRLLSLQTKGPPFQPSPHVQRAMQSDQIRRQYNIDRSPQFTPQPPPQLQSNAQSALLSRSSPNMNSIPSPELPHPQAPQQQIVPPPQQLQQVAPNSLQPPPIAQREPQSRPQTAKAPSMTSNSMLAQTLPLTLPTDKNTHPFCKGSFRLFLGLTKKAFVPANRPVGMSSFMPYWRCDKCLFEGPMHQAPGPPDKKGRPGKPEKIFDPTTRECGPISTAVIGPDGRGEGSGGVRYKWIFLAKCHVPLKSVTEGKHDGTFGSYACMFCCAEGANRGWTTSSGSSLSLGMNGPGLNDAASTFSGRSTHSSNSGPGNTPVFGNISLFMDHLQMHRREENWPCPEMLGRMKCIVGRIADRSDDWEVNFLPL